MIQITALRLALSFCISPLLWSAFSLPCVAGEESRPLEKGQPSPPLITKEYKVPASFLSLIAKRTHVPKASEYLSSSGVPITDAPFALFNDEKRLLVVRATKAGHRAG